MAHSSEVTWGLHFAWRTQWTYADWARQSPVFSFLDAEWCLEMRFGNAPYRVVLHKMTKWEDLEPFEVTAWMENDRKRNIPIRCQTQEILSESTIIWVTHELNLVKEILDFKEDSYFTFVCMLRSVSPSGLKKESKHQSIQFSLDLPFSADSLSLGTRSPPTSVPTSCQSIQAPLKILHDLEGLSLDLGNLLEEGTMSDVQLKCGDGIVPAHRSVLIARSEVFSAMFRNDMAECRSGVVDMPDMDSEVLGLLLKYVYTGKLPEASVELTRKLHASSNKYAIHGLKKACYEWMTGGLTEENCLNFLVLADTHGDAPFKDAVVSFIVDNQGVVFKSSVWLQFQEQQPKLTIEVLSRCLVKRHPGDTFQSCQKCLHEH